MQFDPWVRKILGGEGTATNSLQYLPEDPQGQWSLVSYTVHRVAELETIM